MTLRTRVTRLGVTAATVGVVALGAMGGIASAQVTQGDVTVVPAPQAQTEAVFGAPNATFPGGAYEGDASVLTITVAPNTTFTPGTSLETEECNLDPTSQSECDGLTLSKFNVGGTTSVVPNADGSVTMTMNLWELPTGNTPDSFDPANDYPGGFDPGSTVSCWDAASDPSTAPNPGTAQPCSIWIGDDPSKFTANSFVVNGLTPLAAPATLPTTTTTTVPITTSTTAATTTTTVPTTTTTTVPITTSTTAATTTTTTVPTTTSSTVASTTSSTVASTTSSTIASTSTTTNPSGGQVPESPFVPLLPIAAAGVAGGGFILYRIRRRRISNL